MKVPAKTLAECRAACRAEADEIMVHFRNELPDDPKERAMMCMAIQGMMSDLTGRVANELELLLEKAYPGEPDPNTAFHAEFGR